VVPVNLASGAFSSFMVDAAPSADRPAYVHHGAHEAFLVLDHRRRASATSAS
jgi:hypothetical protein